jgi:hypothetical protein
VAKRAPDAGLEGVGRSAGGGANGRLEPGPHRLDRVEVGRVRRQVQYLRADGFHFFADARVLVRPQVVEHEDVAVPKARREGAANEVDEVVRVNGAVDRRVADDAGAANRADHREVLSPVGRFAVEHALAAHSPAVHRRHRRVEAGFVEKDEPLRRDGGDQRPELLALRLDIGTKLLPRPEAFFFHVRPALCSVRCIAAEEISTP